MRIGWFRKWRGQQRRPDPPSSASELLAVDVSTSITELDDATILFLAQHEVFPPYVWDLERRPPRVWELECRPPVPWDPGAIRPTEIESLPVRTVAPSGVSFNSSAENEPQPESDGDSGGDPPSCGFYRVVRDGVHVVGLTNLTSGPVSNSITLSFEAGNAIGTLQEVNVLVDGVACRGADALVGPPFYPGTITVDTAFLENGDHTFQVQAGWLNPDIGDLNNFMFHRVSDPFTLTVSNVIYYPEWEDEVGELGFSAYFAKTTCTNADWQIDIYDVRSNLVQTLTGHTDDGTIEAYWNLVDTNGVTRTNMDFDPEFSSIITVADPVKKPTPKKKPTLIEFRINNGYEFTHSKSIPV